MTVLPTPRNLDEMIDQILVAPGPLPRMRHEIRLIVTDFLAQQFQKQMPKTPDASRALADLYLDLIKKDE